MIQIAILGLGTVGTGVARVVAENARQIERKLGEPLQVKAVLVRRFKDGPYRQLMTDDFKKIEEDGAIRVVVEAIGGVWFDVPRDMHYDDPYQDLHIHQDKGYRKLTGDDAMQIVRFRHSNDGNAISDITRLKIQHDFLKAVLKQTLQIQNMTKITQLADLFGRRVESDLQVENIMWFGSQAVFGGLGVDDVEFFTMPHYGASNDRNARHYGKVYPNQTELLRVINEKLNPFVEEVTIKQLDLIRVSADGNTLSSSTGVLADPSAGIPPVVNAPEPTAPPESEPPEPTPPAESDPLPPRPAETEPPPASDPPPETAPPVATDPGSGSQQGEDGTFE